MTNIANQPITYLGQVIEALDADHKKLADILGKLKGQAHSSIDTAKDILSQHTDLLGFAKAFRQNPEILTRGPKLYPDLQLPTEINPENIKKAEAIIAEKLETWRESIVKIHSANEKMWTNWLSHTTPVPEELTPKELALSKRVTKPDGGLAEDAVQAQRKQIKELNKQMNKTAEAQAKAASESGLAKYIPSFVYDLIKHHDKAIGLEHNSMPMNFALGTVQTMLGGLLASHAFNYTRQAVSGETVSVKFDKDDQGHITQDLVVNKLSPQARTLMGALGVAGMAAGAGGFFLGLRTQFYNFGKPMIMRT